MAGTIGGVILIHKRYTSSPDVCAAQRGGGGMIFRRKKLIEFKILSESSAFCPDTSSLVTYCVFSQIVSVELNISL